MEISKYVLKHENDVLGALSSDPDWGEFTNKENINSYKDSLRNSVTYVCYSNGDFCGFVRAILDAGQAVYISELYVVKKCRNNKIGQLLLEQVKADFSSLRVYALSDEDAYYHKKGYKNVGSVFEI